MPFGEKQWPSSFGSPETGNWAPAGAALKDTMHNIKNMIYCHIRQKFENFKTLVSQIFFLL